MTCAVCRHENRNGARFCEQCGTRLEEGTGVLLLPETLGGGRYRVERFLGEGARKRVYLARDARLDRDVAVAVVKTGGLDEAGRHRIDREARATARLGDHAHIVTVFDVIEDDGGPQIVSEYVAGGTLAERLLEEPEHRLPVGEAIEIATQLATALEHAHAMGIVHRDIKPANVWLAADGSARLGDFGLAAVTDASRLTSEGMVVGTVAYLAPEQATGRAPDPRADLYSLGAVLYEVLAGRPPFLGDDAVSVMSQHLSTTPVAPSWHNAAVPRGLDSLVLQLLAKDPDDRPQSAAELVTRLRELELGPPPPPESQPPALTADWRRFVGRAEELDALRRACDAAFGGDSRLVVVVGEPGIGKTRLVEEAAVYATVRGAQVWWGHCYEGDIGVPFLPFVEALRGYARSRSDDELREQLGASAPEIATLVSEIRQRLGDLPEPPPLEGDAERMRLFDGVATFLANASRTTPVVIVLDDLHWADKPSLLLLQYLARNLRRERVLVVGTYRDVDLDRMHPLADAIASLRRERIFERILLRGLPRDDVKALIEAVGEQETRDDFADLIHRETEGNPFFVAEVLRHLAETGAFRRVDGRWIGTASVLENLPEGIREVIGRRLNRLSEACNRMLTVASAMPTGFSLDVIGQVTAANEDEVLDLLDEALQRQIVRERRTRPGEYEFTHALIRQTLSAELSTPRRVRLHRQIAEALEDVQAAGRDAPVSALAYHWFQAAPGGGAARAVRYAEEAGRRAEDQAAHEEAARFYDQALQALELLDEIDEHHRAMLRLALGRARLRAGETEAAERVLLDAAEDARRLDLPVLFAEVALVVSTPRLSPRFESERIAMAEEALERLGDRDPALRARLAAQLAALVHLYDVERFERLADEAIEAARASGDVGALARALHTRGFETLDNPRDPELQRRLAEIGRLADEAGDLDLAMNNCGQQRIHAVILGDRRKADRLLTRLEELAARRRSPLASSSVLVHAAGDAVLRGQYDEGTRLADELLALATRLRERGVAANYGVILLPMLREQGRIGELEQPTRAAVASRSSQMGYRVGLAEILAFSGRHDEARAELDAIAADGFGAVPLVPNLPYCLVGSSEVAVLVGSREQASRLYETLLPRAGVAATVAAAAYHGVVDRYLGLLALRLDDLDEAVRRLEVAIAFEDGLGARPFGARARYDLARALAARDRDVDRARAVALLNEALDTANTIGMPVLVQEALAVKLDLQGVGSASTPDASIDAVASAVSIDRPDLSTHADAEGRVAVVFSDIEDYTPLTERLGDVRSQEVLRAHNEILRRELAAHGGTEVKSHGDGFMLVFDDPVAAVRFGVAYQKALAGHDFGADAGRLHAHVGVHVGEVIREGDDFFGRTVILAARIAAAAAGGEVLVSDDVRRAVGAATAFDAGRRVELKGLSGGHRVFPVRL